MTRPVLDDRDVVESSDDAAEAVRGLNHALLDGRGVTMPNQACVTAGNLAQLAARLVQAAELLGDQVTAWRALGSLGIDGATSAAQVTSAVEIVTASLDAAEIAAGQLREAFSLAAETLAYAHHRPVAGVHSAA